MTTLENPDLLYPKTLAPEDSSRLVIRNRLVDIFSVASIKPITMIVAPAGYGKTTLLSQTLSLLQKEEKLVAWVSLDEFDNNPSRFWSYISEALSIVSPSIRKSMAGTRKQDIEPVKCPFIANLINVVSREKRIICLALDDYQFITDDRIHQALEFLLNHLPKNLLLIISSRIYPPFSLSRMRANNVLNEILAEDLRFTFEETNQFLNDVMKLQLHQEEVIEVSNYTLGWIAGIQLAAVSIREKHNVPDFWSHLNKGARYIFDYLFDEVFDNQDEEIKNFLLRTCILKRFNVSICDALTCSNKSKEILEIITKANLFILPLDHTGEWFRYHPLFSDLLRKELVTREPKIIPDLHKRASEWFEMNGFIELALNHSLISGDLACTERLIQKDFVLVSNILLWGDNTSLRKWLENLPQELVVESPFIALLLLWSDIYKSRFDEIHTLSVLIQEKFNSSEPGIDIALKQVIEAELIVILACCSMLSGNYSDSIDLTLRGNQLISEDAFYYRCYQSWCLGESYEHMGDIDKAYQYYADTYNYSELAGGTILSPFSIYEIGRLQMFQGKLRKARNTFEKEISQFEKSGFVHPIPEGLLYTGLGRIFLEWNILEEAEFLINRGLLLLSDQSPLDWLLEAQIALALLRYRQGKEDEAIDILTKASLISGTCVIPREIDCQIFFQLTLFYINADNVIQAALIANRLEKAVHPADPYYFICNNIANFRIGLAKKEYHSFEELNQILSKALVYGFTPLAIELLILNSIFLARMDQTQHAIDELIKGLVIALPEGYVKIFCKDDELFDLLNSVDKYLKSQHKRSDQSTMLEEYIQKLIFAFQGSLPSKEFNENIKNINYATTLVEQLTAREKQIMRLSAAGMEKDEICQRLFIAQNTLKTHYKNIYSKLGVHSLADAISTVYKYHLL